MRWYDWTAMAISLSACMHIAASLWVMNLEHTSIKWGKETSGLLLNPFYPMRFVLQYIQNFLKNSFPMQLWKLTVAVVWLPLAAVCFVLMAIFAVLSFLPVSVAAWWDQRRFKRMTPEQRQAANITREESFP